MKLYDKQTGMAEIIYNISEDSSGYPKFLIRKGRQWKWRSAKHYITREERLKTPYSRLEEVCGIDPRMFKE